eukprot:3447870-Lingulodinium_polyedra.AAC.1
MARGGTGPRPLHPLGLPRGGDRGGAAHLGRAPSAGRGHAGAATRRLGRGGHGRAGGGPPRAGTHRGG